MAITATSRDRTGQAGFWAILVLVAILLAACTAGGNPEVGVASDGDVAGFWLGLWHGFIAPITFFISLFSDNVNLYEVHNNGNWYDFGFVLGAGLLFSGGLFGRKR
ncbi:MAG: hypothetical protein ACRDVL_03045 [Acidimicrobiia bacterium]